MIRSNFKPLYLDIFVDGRFYQQLKYDGFYDVVDGRIEYDSRLVEKFVLEKLPSVSTKHYNIKPTTQRVLK